MERYKECPNCKMQNESWLDNCEKCNFAFTEKARERELGYKERMDAEVNGAFAPMNRAQRRQAK